MLMRQFGRVVLTASAIVHGGYSMWSIWNAPSDRDYYDQFGREEQDEEPDCWHCGARWDQACEEWCCTNMPAPEPPPAESIELELLPAKPKELTRCPTGDDPG